MNILKLILTIVILSAPLEEVLAFDSEYPHSCRRSYTRNVAKRMYKKGYKGVIVC